MCGITGKLPADEIIIRVSMYTHPSFEQWWFRIRGASAFILEGRRKTPGPSLARADEEEEDQDEDEQGGGGGVGGGRRRSG